MRDAAEVRARVAGAARGRAEVRTPSPSSLSMVSGRCPQSVAGKA